MTFKVLDYLTLGDQRFRYNDFRRFTIPVDLPQLQAKRSQPPFIDYEQTGFAGGITNDDGNDEGNTYRSALGMEPIGPDANPGNWLRIGKQIRKLLTGVPPVEAILPFKGLLVLGGTSTAGITTIQTWNGTGVAQQDALPNGCKKLIAFQNNAIAFNNQNGDYSYDLDATGAWTDVVTTSSGTGCHVGAVVYSGTTSRLYRVIDEQGATGNPARLSWLPSPGGADTVIGTLEEKFSRAMVSDGTTLYFAGAETSANSVWGTIYKYDGTNISIMARLTSDYAVSAVILDGKSYWGTLNGHVYVLDGTIWSRLRTFNTVGVSQPLRGLYATADALYVSFVDATTSNITIWRYDGTAWSQPHTHPFTPVGVIAGELSLYEGRLVIADPNSTAGPFEVGATNYAASGRVELQDIVYGVPGTPKSYAVASLSHVPLVAGQSVQLRHTLENSTTEVTDGTNSAIGETETELPLPLQTVGARLRPHFYITNATAVGAPSTAGSSNQFIVYGGRVRAIALPSERQVWQGNLVLRQENFNDGTTDPYDPLEKFESLQALKSGGKAFQALDPFREATATATGVKAAMMAMFDGQQHLEWSMSHLQAGGVLSADFKVPVRMVQAFPDIPINNPSFEADAAGTSGANITGWTQTPGTSTGAASVSTGVTAPDGSRSLALTFATGVAGPSLYGVTQTITGLTGGRYYTVGGYLRRQMSAGLVYIEVSSTGLQVRTRELASATDSAFTWYQRTFQLPAANTAVTLRVQGSSGAGADPVGTLWADKVRLSE